MSTFISRRGRRALRAWIALTGTMPAVLAAQDAPDAAAASRAAPAESVLAARVARLDREYQVLRSVTFARLDSADAARRWVNSTSGGGAMRATESIAAQAAEAAERAWSRIAARGGAPLAAQRRGQVLIVRTDSLHVGTLRATRGVVIRFGSPDGRELRRSGEVVRWPSTTGRLADVMVRAQEQLLSATAADPLEGWLRQQRLPLAPASADEWKRVARARALIASRSLRGCAAGDATGCAAALGLGEHAGPDTWYAAEDHRALFERALPTRRDSALLRNRERCVRSGERAACASVRAAFPDHEIPPPLDAQARRLLVDVALELGGDGALERLLVPGGTIEQRLAEAAKRPLDDLVLAWRDRVERAAPAPTHVPAITLAGTIGWSVLAIFVAGIRRRVA